MRARRLRACRPLCLAFLTCLAVLGLAWLGCAGGGEEAAGGGTAGASWSVTAWGEAYEVFAEAPTLAAGEAASVHTHVTLLDGFTPLAEGRVEVVLRGPRDEAFAATGAERPGLFDVQVTPGDSGERELVFRVSGPAGSEEIRGGLLRVGGDGEAGALLRAPAPRGATGGGEPVSFTKEQQWQADFATDWVRRDSFADSARGLARLRAPAGGDVAVTAPVDAVVRPSPWPYPGLTVESGAPLFRLLPRVSEGRSLAELESRVRSLAAELEAARARQDRLDDLLELEAVSRRETEEARARVSSLTSRLEAATRDLESARSARSGGGGGDTVLLTSPIAGRVAAVPASPGEAVAAGQTLARVVRTDPVWVEVSLSPDGARRVAAHAAAGLGGLVLDSGDGAPTVLAADRVRLVSVAPQVDAATGRVPVLVEVAGGLGLPLDSTADAELLLPGETSGVVVPTAALVDDGGVPVVYLQLAGERFVREEVEVLARRGDRALVEGLRPGQRLVTRGGEAIRRSTLMATGGGHGHVH